jgi:uncharacterized RDD family membrane protein YckC
MASEVEEPLTQVGQYYGGTSTTDTVVPRYIAAMIDNAIAMVLAVIAAKSIGDSKPILQATILVAVYLGYYFIPEVLLSRSLGKLFTGLVIVGLDGKRCSWRQAAIRTVFRLIEVNPLLLGAIPAALSVVFSANHQRFGDKVAKTLVVASRPLPRLGLSRG